MKNLIKILIIDDAFERIAGEFSEYKDFEIIETGATTNSLEGASKISQYKDADFILLDMQLGEENDAGAKIAGLLGIEIKEKTIGIAGETISKQVFNSLGIYHVPGKRISDIVKCLKGECNCGKKKAKSEIDSKIDVLLVSKSEPLKKSLKRVLSTLSNQKKIEYCGDKSDELIESLLKYKPREVIYQIDYSGYRRNPMRIAEHDYYHMAMDDKFLPDFDELFGHALVIDTYAEENRKEAEKLGHYMLKSPLQINELLGVLSGQLNEDKSKELEILSKPIFSHDEKTELIDIARTMSPTSAKYCALNLVKNEKIAKACRYLSIIKRDYGKKVFEEVVARNS